MYFKASAPLHVIPSTWKIPFPYLHLLFLNSQHLFTLPACCKRLPVRFYLGTRYLFLINFLMVCSHTSICVIIWMWSLPPKKPFFSKHFWLHLTVKIPFIVRVMHSTIFWFISFYRYCKHTHKMLIAAHKRVQTRVWKTMFWSVICILFSSPLYLLLLAQDVCSVHVCEQKM